MHYSDIKRQIINKNFLWGYSIIIFISLIFGCLIYVNKSSISLNNDFYVRTILLIISFLCLSVLSICYGLANLYRCQSFYKFYKNHLKEHNTHFRKIVIEKENYKMPMPNTPRNVTIRPAPKSTNAVYLETEEFLLLFFSIRYLGLVRQVLKPFIFIKNNKEFYAKGANINIIRDFETIETGENRILIFPNSYGITKIIIPLPLLPSQQKNRDLLIIN
jgi:hypothetical protein